MNPYVIEFAIEGLPKTPNSLLGAPWRIRAGHAKTWERKIWMYCQHLRPEKPLPKAKLTLTRLSSVQSDYDGLVGSFKAVIDALKKCSIIVDDSQAIIGIPDYRFEKTAPKKGRIRIKVESV